MFRVLLPQMFQPRASGWLWGSGVGSLEPWPSLCPSSAMPTEGHHFGLGSRKWGQRYRLGGGWPLAPPKGLGHTMIDDCRTGVSSLCPQPWAQPVPSTVLVNRKVWHQDRLYTEATHSTPATLALKGFLGWSRPSAAPHGHWWSEPPQGSCRAEGKFTCLLPA